MLACLLACLLACKLACLLACFILACHACLPACLHACLPACMLACLLACLQGSSKAAFREAKDWALQLMATSAASDDAKATRVQNLPQAASGLSVPVKAASHPVSLNIKQQAVDPDASGPLVAQICTSQAATTNMTKVTSMSAVLGVAAQSGAGMRSADAATVLGPTTPSGPTFRRPLDSCATQCAHNPADASEPASSMNLLAPERRQDSEQTTASECHKAAFKQAISISTGVADKPQKSAGCLRLQWLAAAALPAGSKSPHTASASSGLHQCPEARDQTAALVDADLTAPEQTIEGNQRCGVVTAGPMLIHDMASEPTPSCHQSQAINLIDCLRPQSRSAVIVTAGSSGAAATCIQPEPGSLLLQLSCPAQAPTSSKHPYLSNALPAAFAQNITQLAKQTGNPAMAFGQSSLSDTAFHNPVRSSVLGFRADTHTQPSQELPLSDLLCASTFSQAAPCIPAHTPSPAPATQLPGGPCLGLLNAIREKPHNASDQGFLIALKSCSVKTVTEQPKEGLALCPVPTMGALGSSTRHADALEAAPFCLSLPKASGLQQEPWQKAEGCLSASTVPFCPSRVCEEPIAAGFGHNPTAPVTPQVCDTCDTRNLA